MLQKSIRTYFQDNFFFSMRTTFTIFHLQQCIYLHRIRYYSFKMTLFSMNFDIYCVCGNISTSLHYVLECTLSSTFLLKKHTQMTLSNWIKCVKQKNSCHKQNYIMMNHLEKKYILQTHHSRTSRLKWRGRLGWWCVT